MSTFKRAIFYTIGVVVLSFVYLHHYLIKRPSRRQRFEQTKLGKWNKARLSKRTTATDGSKYFLYTRKGNSRNLMVYFSGGGGCWNGETANVPLSLRSYLKHGQFGYYFARIPFYILNMHGGMFDRKPENPFSEWNVVFIPYASGDFHVGDTSANYVRANGKGARHIRHNGKNNVEEALKWVYDNFEAPEKLLIAGSSAGGFGSAFYATQIAKRYSSSEIYHLSDSSFLESESWPDIVNKNWNADFKRRFSYPMEADMIGAAFMGNARSLPNNVVLLHACTVYDKVLTSFQGNLDVKGDDVGPERTEAWTRQLRASTRRLVEHIPNFHYFLTDYGYDEKTHTTPHTLLPMKAFYEAQEEGVTLVNWLDGIINRKSRVSLGSRFLKEGEGSNSGETSALRNEA
ncbi:pectin acetylesterase-family hydrolase [Cohnella abietis]|uniref:Pectinacetylesterase n=1 Tax=Cohnella abietis TaxID=2507935 RepID=A0A3T1D9T1_9BACL|nr:pectin acetylesterase-family hydrolase [Cohnella abietis]BBI34805.1 hypothetical protein KCTCHS21_42040 [Cohnella abietis]